jgi:hypothetical protein
MLYDVDLSLKYYGTFYTFIYEKKLTRKERCIDSSIDQQEKMVKNYLFYKKCIF